MNDKEDENIFGPGIPTSIFGDELEDYLGRLDRGELATKLEEFGFSEEAESLRLRKTGKSEVRSLLFMCYDHMRSQDRWKARHDRKRAKKKGD